MTLFSHLSPLSQDEIISRLFSHYKKEKYGIVHYLYFANIIANNILKNENSEYFHALQNADFLLPDGIALQLFCKKYFWLSLHNLNGTDLSVKILKSLQWKKVNFIMYGAKQEVITKAKKFVETTYKIPVFYAQNGYSEFDFSKLDTMPDSEINILMVGLWTPKQEVWIEKNKENIKKYSLLTFSQWGTFDFWAGSEKRAPKIFLQLKLEWFWRLLINPKKNFKKVYYSLFLFWYLWKKK